MKNMQQSSSSNNYKLTLTSNLDYDIDATYMDESSYPYITIKAREVPNWTFFGWSDGNFENPRTLYMTSDVELEAIYIYEETSISIDNGYFYKIWIKSKDKLNELPKDFYRVTDWTVRLDLLTTANSSIKVSEKIKENVKEGDICTLISPTGKVIYQGVISQVSHDDKKIKCAQMQAFYQGEWICDNDRSTSILETEIKNLLTSYKNGALKGSTYEDPLIAKFYGPINVKTSSSTPGNLEMFDSQETMDMEDFIYDLYKKHGIIFDTVIPFYSWTAGSLKSGYTNIFKFEDSDRYLPKEYTMLKYIKSDGSQYINTAYIPKLEDRFILDCNVTQDSARTNEALFGTRLGTFESKAYCFYTRFNGEDKACYNRSNEEKVGDPFIFGKDVELSTLGQKASWSDGSTEGSISTDGTVEDCGNPLFLFNINTASLEGGSLAGDAASVYELQGFTIERLGTKIRDYVPALRNSDKKPGLYDLVTNEFITNAAGNNFTYEVETDPKYLYKPNTIVSKNNESIVELKPTLENDEVNKLVLFNSDGTYRKTYVYTYEGVLEEPTELTGRLSNVKTKVIYSDDDLGVLKTSNIPDELYNHKIEFEMVYKNNLYHFDDWKLGQNIVINYKGDTYRSVFTGYEISCKQNSAPDTVKITCGKVRTSLTKKLTMLTIK